MDTTGAGDAFSATLALAVAEVLPLGQIVRRANAAGALVVIRWGTMPAMRTREEIDAFLTQHYPCGRGVAVLLTRLDDRWRPVHALRRRALRATIASTCVPDTFREWHIATCSCLRPYAWYNLTHHVRFSSPRRWPPSRRTALRAPDR